MGFGLHLGRDYVFLLCLCLGGCFFSMECDSVRHKGMFIKYGFLGDRGVVGDTIRQ